MTADRGYQRFQHIVHWYSEAAKLVANHGGSSRSTTGRVKKLVREDLLEAMKSEFTDGPVVLEVDSGVLPTKTKVFAVLIHTQAGQAPDTIYCRPIHQATAPALATVIVQAVTRVGIDLSRIVGCISDGEKAMVACLDGVCQFLET